MDQKRAKILELEKLEAPDEMRRYTNNSEENSCQDENDIEGEKITIVIEDEQIICNKLLLLNHSDYFRVMFEGNFVEKNKNIVLLKGINQKVMRDLLDILQNRQCFTLCDDVYAVLSACGMFLFEGLKTWIISQLDRIITPKNSLQMWVELEPLEIFPLCWKAKSISLNNFNEIIDNGAILDLSINEVCIYLGHVNLQCDTELSVFKLGMCWYQKHSRDMDFNKAPILKRILACISFKQATVEEIVQMKNYSDIESSPEISRILEYTIMLKSGREIDENIEDNAYRTAQKWLNSRERYLPKYPCLLMKNEMKKPNVENPESIMSEVVYYDHKSNCFKNFSAWPIDKCGNLTGFAMHNYKMEIFLFGGEFSMGKGSWNYDVWSFDFGKDKLEQKQSMPTPRRHFESCVCGDYLYIVGGTGSYRVIQDNMYWYNFQKGTWSKEVHLPCSGRQIKCCSVNKQLFIFNLSDKCGYFFSQETALWKRVVIDNPIGVISKVLTPFSIFSYKGNLFLKGDNLIELQFIQDKLEIVKVTPLVKFYDDDFVETVASHNYVYTLFKHNGENEDKMSLELLNLDTLEIKFLSDFTSETTSTHKIEENKSETPVKLFMLHHYDLISHNELVN